MRRKLPNFKVAVDRTREVSPESLRTTTLKMTCELEHPRRGFLHRRSTNPYR